MDEFSEKLIARYYDGELGAAERARAEALLAKDSEARAALERMTRMGGLFQAMSDQSLDGVSFEGLDKRVMNVAGRQNGKVPFSERFGVWLSEVVHHRKAIWIPAASFAGIAAAALLVVALQTGTPLGTLPSSARGDTWQASVVRVAAGSEATLANAAEVPGKVYQVAGDDGASIGVVWINE